MQAGSRDMTGKHKSTINHTRSFAAVVGSPGIRPRFTGLIKTVLPVFLFMFVAGYFLRAAFPVPAMSGSVAGLVLVLSCVFLAGSLMMSEKWLTAYFKGAKGEEEVARALYLLPADYTVFHGLLLPGEKGDLDHVVVGPSGIFSVETKNWSGTICVENQKVLYNDTAPTRPPIAQAQQAGSALQAILEKELGHTISSVFPVLCFAQGRITGAVKGVAGVQLCTARDICQVILDQTDGTIPDEERLAVVESLKSIDRRSA